MMEGEGWEWEKRGRKMIKRDERKGEVAIQDEGEGGRERGGKRGRGGGGTRVGWRVRGVGKGATASQGQG